MAFSGLGGVESHWRNVVHKLTEFAYEEKMLYLILNSDETFELHWVDYYSKFLMKNNLISTDEKRIKIKMKLNLNFKLSVSKVDDLFINIRHQICLDHQEFQEIIDREQFDKAKDYISQKKDQMIRSVIQRQLVENKRKYLPRYLELSAILIEAMNSRDFELLRKATEEQNEYGKKMLTLMKMKTLLYY